MGIRLIRHDREGETFFFENGTGQRCAVAEVQARLSKAADAALTPDATIVERARYLARLLFAIGLSESRQ